MWYISRHEIVSVNVSLYVTKSLRCHCFSQRQFVCNKVVTLSLVGNVKVSLYLCLLQSSFTFLFLASKY